MTFTNILEKCLCGKHFIINYYNLVIYSLLKGLINLGVHSLNTCFYGFYIFTVACSY